MIRDSDSLLDLRPAVEALLGRPVPHTEQLVLSLRDVMNEAESRMRAAYTAGLDRGAWGEVPEDPEPPTFEEWLHQQSYRHHHQSPTQGDPT